MKLRQAGKNRRKMLWLAAAIGTLVIAASLVVTAAVAWQFYSIRTAVRWPAWSVRYKSEVLAQSNTTGKLKHIEWDGWGWAGQDTTVYLVFDPTDSLAQKGSFLAPVLGGLLPPVLAHRKMVSRYTF